MKCKLCVLVCLFDMTTHHSQIKLQLTFLEKNRERTVNLYLVLLNQNPHTMGKGNAALAPKAFDVFISFRLEDTPSNFIDHLYDALYRKGIRPYIDNDLPRGEDINSSLMRAIEDSRIFVVIFSENYANSKWLLNELVKIIECQKDQGQVVVPVFYKVHPSHVLHQKWIYNDAFDKHQRDFKHDQQIRNKWRDALSHMANISNWYSENYR